MTDPLDLVSLRALAEAALAIEEDLEELDSDETVYERSEITDFAAAANPATVLALLDRIAGLESEVLEYHEGVKATQRWMRDMDPSNGNGLLLNLLAVIHRDGGHYRDEHGLEKATADATSVVYSDRTRITELESALREACDKFSPQYDCCSYLALANGTTAEEERSRIIAAVNKLYDDRQRSDEGKL